MIEKKSMKMKVATSDIEVIPQAQTEVKLVNVAFHYKTEEMTQPKPKLISLNPKMSFYSVTTLLAKSIVYPTFDLEFKYWDITLKDGSIPLMDKNLEDL